MINYYLLTKPGIILGNLITLASGFFLASKNPEDLPLFFATLSGLAAVMASACILNNYIDRELDAKMERTKQRALVLKVISNTKALCLAFLLGTLGMAILIQFTNGLAAALAAFGFFVYVVLYTFWKVHTVHGTLIGSIAGAVPPVVGYVAASRSLDSGALILFAILVLWQMPHFFAIALYRLEEYRKAGIPVLPLVKGVQKTKIHMALYIGAFTLACFLMSALHYTGVYFFLAAAFSGTIWLFLSLKGLKTEECHLFGKSLFRVSLVIITLLCLIIPLDS